MMKMGYEVYSGTMIGLPFQTDENLIEDVLMMKELKVDGLECDSRWPPPELRRLRPHEEHAHLPLLARAEPCG